MTHACIGWEFLINRFGVRITMISYNSFYTPFSCYPMDFRFSFERKDLSEPSQLQSCFLGLRVSMDQRVEMELGMVKKD